MKIILNGAIGMIIAIAFMYVVFSFNYVTFDFAKWTSDGRFSFCEILVIIFILTAFITAFYYSDKGN